MIPPLGCTYDTDDRGVILGPEHKSERECFVAAQVSPTVGKGR